MARLDDLQAQVTAKDRAERRLEQEKCQLEQSVSSSSKAVERMSQNVEELQWRISNNYHLPLGQSGREGGSVVEGPACLRWVLEGVGVAICILLKIDYTVNFRPLLIDLNHFQSWNMMREAIGLDLAF